MRKPGFSSTSSFPRLRAHSTEDGERKHALFKDYQIGLSRLLFALCWPRKDRHTHGGNTASTREKGRGHGLLTTVALQLQTRQPHNILLDEGRTKKLCRGQIYLTVHSAAYGMILFCQFLF